MKMKIGDIHDQEGELKQLSEFAKVQGYASLAEKIASNSITYDMTTNMIGGVTEKEAEQLAEIEEDFCKNLVGQMFGKV